MATLPQNSLPLAKRSIQTAVWRQLAQDEVIPSGAKYSIDQGTTLHPLTQPKTTVGKTPSNFSSIFSIWVLESSKAQIPANKECLEFVRVHHKNHPQMVCKAKITHFCPYYLVLEGHAVFYFGNKCSNGGHFCLDAPYSIENLVNGKFLDEGGEKVTILIEVGS